jgi:RHS repeat-associated protein
MDFTRVAVFALGLILGSIGTARASALPQATPVRTATDNARVAPYSGRLSYQSLIAKPMDVSGTIPDVTYGAPYYFGAWSPGGNGCTNGTGHNTVPKGPSELTTGAAVTDYENSFVACFGVSCNWTVDSSDPNYPEDPAIFAYVVPVSGCTGGEDIYGTATSHNVGDGNVNGDGEGDQVNEAAPDVGDPVNASSGNKYIKQSDYLDSSSWLTFRRFYNSNAYTPRSFMGDNWRHSFDRSLSILGSPISSIIMTRPDGSQETFTKANGAWASNSASVDQLTETDNAQGAATAYTVFIGSNRHTETYNTSGLLLSVTDQTGEGVTLTYSTASTPTTVAPEAGLLITVTDPKGRQLNFTYYSSGVATGQLDTVTLPDGGKLTYAYNGNGWLTSVEYPDSSTRQYLYNENDFVQASEFESPYLTGITDESGIRYSSTGYDTNNRAWVTLLGGEEYSTYGGANNTQVTYNSDGTSIITYPLGITATLGYVQTPSGQNQIASVSQPCGPVCGQKWSARTYDANGYPASSTDFNSNVTTTQYDAYGELNVEVDASGTTSQRTINTTWNTTLRVPLTRTVLDENGNAVTKTAWVYNTMAQPLAMCQIDPAKAGSYVCAATGTPPAGVRRWTYTYCTAVGTNCPLVGLLLTATGSRTDLTQTTQYAYYTTSSSSNCGTPGAACYQAGDLHTITDAAGHVTTIASYDADGRVTRSTDANGVNTDSTYTPRGWLATRTIGGATTTLTYWPYGAIETITDPDGVITTYLYDNAHRLIKISDSQNESIEYTLDGAGNKTAEQTYSVNPVTLVRSVSRTYNTLGQLTAIADGLGVTVFSAGTAGSYDANSNLILSSDALGIQNENEYDPLNRLITTIKNYEGTDTATQNTSTTVAFDALDRVTGISDPNALNTVYSYDGLNDRTALQSPDTGSSSDTYDAAGNRLTHTDAKGIVATSTYDALNRLIGTTYPDTTQNVTYSYDDANSVTGCTSSDPIGRLTRIAEYNVTTIYCYDARGNVLQKSQVLGTHTDKTVYTYTSANRLNTEQMPDGTLTTYAYDSNGHISGMTLTPAGSSTAATVVSGVTWLPFGPVSGYTLGNGQTITRTYDANYRLTDLTSPALTLHFARDEMGDIDAIGNAAGASPATETYAYDPLYRLTRIVDSGTSLETYTYNKTGDRLSKVAPGLATGTYSYTTNTHQLIATGNAARTNDANGNTTGSTVASNAYGFGYNDRNRLVSVLLNGTTVGTYSYNALGQRIQKVTSASERYGYDEANHLVGEYGGTNRDYVWMGDIPVAIVDVTINGSTTTSVVNYVHADHLNTPRAVANSSGTVIWAWAFKGNPFGEQQPTSSSGYTLNLRLPGQYFDEESGLSDNLNRSFDPTVGRYSQSDPLGLLAGMSTFAYTSNNPMAMTDPLGLWQVTITGGAVFGVQLTFGENNGQWNFGAHVGLAEGLAGSYNPNTSEEHTCGDDWGVQASGQIGLGDTVEAEGYVSTNQDESSATVAFNDPVVNGIAYGVDQENHVFQPIGDPSWGGGEALFVGPGVTWYSSSGH